jgi:hypothetical protein
MVKHAQRGGVEPRAQAAWQGLRGLAALCLVWSCASGAGGAGPTQPAGGSELVRYRLLLRDNPVDAGGAFRCYTKCQPQTTPEGYLACLEACPGYETTRGVACTPEEVPPLAVCFTARPAPAQSEPEPGSILVGTLAGVPLMVGMSAVCASSHSQCYGVVPNPR